MKKTDMATHERGGAAQGAPDAPGRRRFILGGATAAAAVALGRGGNAMAAGGGRVAVLGGGVAGLTAAHELCERGYQVTVYERRALGGKARSFPVPGTGTGGRQNLPGEHGFRFFPNFYRNLPDTLRRIPYPGNARGAWDNLVSLPESLFAVDGGDDIRIPIGNPLSFTPTDLPGLVTSFFGALGIAAQIPPHEMAFIVEKMVVYLTSSDARRYGQWERMSWWEYTRAGHMSEAYQTYIGHLPLGFVAARGEHVSTRTIGDSSEAFIYTMAERNVDDHHATYDRILNRPTNAAWIDPWVEYLGDRGVSFLVGTEITGLDYTGGRIAAALARDAGGADRRIEADWYVLAVPFERAIGILDDPAILAADPQLGAIGRLEARWMTGIQFFLRERANIAEGHFLALGSPWALTGLSQAQFWPLDFAATYGDGTIRDVLSIDISDWDTAGILYGKTAKECSPDEIAHEVLAQLRRAFDAGDQALPAGIIDSYVLDPGILEPGTPQVQNEDPLLINTPGSWDNRPTTQTAIPNLFLAGDHVRATGFDLASMETANESGRRATNAILEASASSQARATIYERYKEPLLLAARTTDAGLYQLGLPNQHDLLMPYFPSARGVRVPSGASSLS